MKLRLNFVANSSSEVFIIRTDKTLAQITDNLVDIIMLHNKITGENLEFNDVFRLPQYADIGDESTIRSYSRDFTQIKDGDIALYSATDNSIPWHIVEWIQGVYEADRTHLG